MDRVFAAAVKLEEVRPSSVNSFGALVSTIVFNAFVLAGIIFFVLLVFGGFAVMVGAGSGDAKQMEQAKNTVVSAVVGLLVVVASYWIVQILGTLTGINLLKPSI